MADLNLIQSLQRNADTKIILLVIDGLGGLPLTLDGPTELEAAQTPNLDRLAAEGTLGQIVPVHYGITPGSGPAHLALFGYDPLLFDVGRGVLEASGVGMQVAVGDVAARGNFCTVDKQGNIVDRRAGRIPTEECGRLCEIMDGSVALEGVEVFIRPVKEHRAVIVLRS
ncbi:MAG TPA: phosphoglycerate mutase, partial [Anaerolineae bacterium]|nr:phosphoglycerate mutase [Anaerolineae bacterium]